MFSKATLTFLVIGVLSVNALTIPVARSPAPEPESRELEAWMLRRDLSYDLISRELQALHAPVRGELQALHAPVPREPEDWAKWVKREPSPCNDMYHED